MTTGNPFQLIDTALPQAAPGSILGLWAQSAPPPSGAVAFSLDASAPPPDVQIWRVELSADPARAARQLATAEVLVQQAERALNGVNARIAAIRPPVPGSPAVSFALPSEATSPEDRLIAALAIPATGPGVSFGLGEEVQEGLASALERFNAFTAQVTRAVLTMAWVETQIEGQLMARTVASWSGRTTTVLLPGLSAPQQQLHQRSLHVASTSRIAFLRTFTLIVRGASEIAVKFALPGGPIRAVPAAWNFINALIAEVQRGKENRELGTEN